MIERTVIQGGRGTGKTTIMMDAVHDAIVAGESVAVVFPASNWIHWWTRMWNERYPFVPMVHYTVINNSLKLRGYTFTKIFVEDVDGYPEGIHDERLRDLIPHFRGGAGEIMFTSSLIELNQRSHNAETNKNAVLNAMQERQRRKRAIRALEDEIVVHHMLDYIDRHGGK